MRMKWISLRWSVVYVKNYAARTAETPEMLHIRIECVFRMKRRRRYSGQDFAPEGEQGFLVTAKHANR